MSQKHSLFTILSLFISIFTFSIISIGSPVHAQQSDVSAYVGIINSTKGVNLRGMNCEVLKVLPFETTIGFLTNGAGWELYEGFAPETQAFNGEPYTKTCTVQGKVYQMELISLDTTNQIPAGYVAVDFITRPFSSISAMGPGVPRLNPMVNAKNGLNVRDENCKKVGAVPFQYKFATGPATGFTSPQQARVCKVNGQYYEMWFVWYNNQYRYVAVSYLDFLNTDLIGQ